MSEARPARHSPILNSVRQLSATALGILQTRLALAGIELEEEIQRLIAVLLLAFGMLIFVALGLLVFTLLIVLAFDPDHRLAAMAVLTAVYLAVGAGFWVKLRRMLAARPAIFEATLAELEKDRHALKPARPADSEEPAS